MTEKDETECLHSTECCHARNDFVRFGALFGHICLDCFQNVGQELGFSRRRWYVRDEVDFPDSLYSLWNWGAIAA